MKNGILAAAGLAAILGAGALILPSGEVTDVLQDVAARQPTTRAAVVARACADVPLDVEKHDLMDGSCLVMAPDSEKLDAEVSDIAAGSGRRLMACWDSKVKRWSQRWGRSAELLPAGCHIVLDDPLAPGIAMTGIDLGEVGKLCARFCPTVVLEDCPVRPNASGPVWRCAAMADGSWDVRRCQAWCEGR